MTSLRETASTIFPGCTLLGTADDDQQVEVTLVTAGSFPQNCEVLARGEFRYAPRERVRRSYLVRANGLMLIVRVLPESADQCCAQIIVKSRSAAPLAPRRLH